jgi:hypothetical protein
MKAQFSQVPSMFPQVPQRFLRPSRWHGYGGRSVSAGNSWASLRKSPIGVDAQGSKLDVAPKD